MGPETLSQVLRDLPKFEDKNLLVGFDKSDDAAVYKIDENTAVIQTLDFFTPVVDDPYDFGAIAAANALSDVYAMGGKPTLCMNIVGFPNCLDPSILAEILKGGADKVKEAGAILVGGHSIEDKEPKYGLSVMGMVHPEKVLANSNAKTGDCLIMTKPLGNGILNTALKEEMLDGKTTEKLIHTMKYLNKYAFEVAERYNINACTDITGFGLIGHLSEMAKASDVTIEVLSQDVAYIDEAYELAELGIIPAGAYRNREYFKKDVVFNSVLAEALIDIMYDPQTSGGLLFSLPEEEANKLLQELKASVDVNVCLIGKVKDKNDNFIEIV